MIVIVIIFHIINVIMSVIHGPLRWHGRTQEARALARGSWREPRQLKKYPRSRRQVEISEGVRNKQRERQLADTPDDSQAVAEVSHTKPSEPSRAIPRDTSHASGEVDPGYGEGLAND